MNTGGKFSLIKAPSSELLRLSRSTTLAFYHISPSIQQHNNVPTVPVPTTVPGFPRSARPNISTYFDYFAHLPSLPPDYRSAPKPEPEPEPDPAPKTPAPTSPITIAPVATVQPITAANAVPITTAPVLSFSFTHPITAPPVTRPPIAVQPTTSAPISAAPIMLSPATQIPFFPFSFTHSPVAAPVTAAPVTAAPVTAPPVTRAPITVQPTTSAPISTAPVTVSPVTAAPVIPDSDRTQLYRREYSSRLLTLELEGDIDLAATEGIIFQIMEQEMTPYLVETVGPALEDFELSVTFQYTATLDRGRRLKEMINAEVAVMMTFVHANPRFVESYSQEEIDMIVHGFFEGDTLHHLKVSIEDSGVDITALSTVQVQLEPEETEPTGNENSSLAAVVAGLLSGGLVISGLMAAILCRQQRYRVQQEVESHAAKIVESQQFLPNQTSSNHKIASSKSEGLYQEALLDAPTPDKSANLNKDVGFQMTDGPDLVASSPAIDQVTNVWDDRSMAESTVFTRTNLPEDRPRPEYNSKQRGQRFRPWENKSDPKQPAKLPAKRSRLMRSFKQVRNEQDDIASLDSANSMRPQVHKEMERTLKSQGALLGPVHTVKEEEE